MLQGEMSQPDVGALTWIYGSVATRSKKMVFLPFITSNVEWLESDRKHGGADVLHERLGANADIQAGKIVLELEPGAGGHKDETHLNS